MYKLWVAADEGGAADPGASGGDVTATTTYRTSFAGRAGEIGTATTRTSDGDVSTSQCYTAPGLPRNCGK